MEWEDRQLVAVFDPTINYLWHGMDDAGQAVPAEWFEEAVAFVLEAMTDSQSVVLVHCHMGINRGPSGWSSRSCWPSVGSPWLRWTRSELLARWPAWRYAGDALRWHLRADRRFRAAAAGGPGRRTEVARGGRARYRPGDPRDQGSRRSDERRVGAVLAGWRRLRAGGGAAREGSDAGRNSALGRRRLLAGAPRLDRPQLAASWLDARYPPDCRRGIVDGDRALFCGAIGFVAYAVEEAFPVPHTGSLVSALLRNSVAAHKGAFAAERVMAHREFGWRRPVLFVGSTEDDDRAGAGLGPGAGDPADGRGAQRPAGSRWSTTGGTRTPRRHPGPPGLAGVCSRLFLGWDYEKNGDQR